MTSPLIALKLAYPQAEEDREQDQRIFERLAERFSLFGEETCSFYCTKISTPVVSAPGFS